MRTFLRRGAMKHDLAAVIPGADPIPDDIEGGEAGARIRAALDAFERFDGIPAPHFAYGPVTKAEYERLHAMHVANHFARAVIA
jgi:hypothetical protein